MLELSQVKKVSRNHPLAEKIRKQITKALADFNMITEGDKIMVCVSGGKDSSILTILLEEIRKKAPMNFTLEAVMLDQKQPGFSADKFRLWLEHEEGIKLHIIERNTYSIVTEKVKSGAFCSLCSKLRRAILYDFAFENKFHKMALGHHRDDVIETTLLNLFYTGQLSTMPAKLKSDDQRNIVLRPLMYVAEKDLIELAEIWNFPIIPCNLCGSQEGLKRNRMKKLISDLEKEIPNLAASFQNALENVKPSHLMDQKLFNFKDLKIIEKNEP
ncbi:MAG: tRNA 2-thiocytidine(32) synthetase TtcA [Pseudobdellovibrio sp.]